MLSANVCARFVCYCFGEMGVQRFWGFVGAPWGLVCMGDTSSAGDAFWAEGGGGIVFVTLGEFPGSHKKVLVCFDG